MARKSRKHDVAIVEDCSYGTKFSSYTAAAYLRLSSDDKKKRGDSIETQRNIIENFIANNPEIQLGETYIDNGISGQSFDRPGFKKMLEDVENHRINCIIIKDLSRFGRNAIDTGYYIEKYLPSLGVRVIAVTDSFDSNDDDGGIILPLKNMINEAYALDISRKCKAVKQQNIESGLFIGRLAPYGYKISEDDCHKLTIDIETAPIVRQIFDWAITGNTAGEIVRRLNEASIPTPGSRNESKGFNSSKKQKGNPYWKLCTVKGMLSDRVYVGDMVQGKARMVNNKRIEVDASEWVCVPNTHEPIISLNVFDRIQSMRKEVYEQASTIKKLPYTPHVLKGKVFCAHCGYPMHRHKQNNHDYYWYRCQSQVKYGKSTCVQVSVKEEDLKTEVFALLGKYTEVVIGNIAALHKSTPQSKTDAEETELRTIRQEIDNNSRFRKSLYESLVSGFISRDEFVQMKSDYESKLSALSKRADELRNQRRELEKRTMDNFDLFDCISSVKYKSDLTAEIIDKLIEKILVRQDKSFEVFFRFEDEMREVYETVQLCG